MSTRAAFSALACGAATLLLAGSASGAGPWPGLAQSLRADNGVVYAAALQAGATTVTATNGAQVVATRQLKGRFGIPAVTLTGGAGGLSVAGKLLVLAQPPDYS